LEVDYSQIKGSGTFGCVATTGSDIVIKIQIFKPSEESPFEELDTINADEFIIHEKLSKLNNNPFVLSVSETYYVVCTGDVLKNMMELLQNKNKCISLTTNVEFIEQEIVDSGGHVPEDQLPIIIVQELPYVEYDLLKR
jgi:hypothetical protein